MHELIIENNIKYNYKFETTSNDDTLILVSLYKIFKSISILYWSIFLLLQYETINCTKTLNWKLKLKWSDHNNTSVNSKQITYNNCEIL